MAEVTTEVIALEIWSSIMTIGHNGEMETKGEMETNGEMETGEELEYPPPPPSPELLIRRLFMVIGKKQGDVVEESSLNGYVWLKK